MARAYGAAFLDKHGVHLGSAQKRALRDVVVCRTKALGGHVERCAGCAQERIAYNSCRNRHCPKCQGAARRRWLAREAEYLLPVDYYHVVFTLPPAIAELALWNRRTLYNLLFEAARDTLVEVAADPRHLGALPGLLMVLHTWGQNLHHHPHVHVVATGGGLSCDSHGAIDAEPRWVSCRPGFFLPVRVVSRVFRGKYLAGLRSLYEAGKLVLAGKFAALAPPAPLHGREITLPPSPSVLRGRGVGGEGVFTPAFVSWLTPLYKQDWVVYAKRPLGGRPDQVLKYLARYTHRVAISNQRLVSLTPSPLGGEGRVTFRLKDYADSAKQKQMTLDATEFLRRFLTHVLPKGFVKIRRYGLLANRKRRANLQTCRRLLLAEMAARGLGVPAIPQEAATADKPQPDNKDTDGRLCPVCGGRLLRLMLLLPERQAAPWDSS